MTAPPVHRRAWLWHSGALLALPALATAAPHSRRLALVIGNGAYPPPAELPNPVRDAEAVAAALRSTGFDVTLLRDATGAAMNRAIAAFSQRLKDSDGTALLYYAGHGMQLDWRNYMLPIDARFDSALTVHEDGIDVADLLLRFRTAGARINIVVLDACRDTPFPGLTSRRGLAPMAALPGTFLAYATAPGHVAMDGPEGGNSLYTAALVRELVRPQARIEDVFKRVRLQVRQRSDGRQVPWESTSLEDDFVFATGERVQPASDTEVAQAFERERPDWQRVRDTRRPEELYAFLDKHPSGLTATAAQERLDLLEAKRLVPQPAAGMEAPNGGDIDSRVGDWFEWQYHDGLTGLPTRRETWRVTAVQGERVEINGGRIVLTPTGSSVRNDMGITFDPPLPAPRVSAMHAGLRWHARSAQHRAEPPPVTGWVDVKFVVRGLEPVAVPAGRFLAWRGEGEVSTFSGLRGSATFWMAPVVGVVRFEQRTRNRDGGHYAWARELLAYHLESR